MANLHDKEQFPINVFGPKGMHSIVGMHTIVFEGVTGLVGTSLVSRASRQLAWRPGLTG